MADDHPAAIQRAAIATKDAAIATSTATYTPARVTTSSPPTLAAASSVPITAPFASLPNRRPGTWYSPAHAVVLLAKELQNPLEQRSVPRNPFTRLRFRVQTCKERTFLRYGIQVPDLREERRQNPRAVLQIHLRSAGRKVRPRMHWLRRSVLQEDLAEKPQHRWW